MTIIGERLSTPARPGYKGQRASAALDDRQKSLYAWQDEIRDPNLTVLLALELCLVFPAALLDAKGCRFVHPRGENDGLEHPDFGGRADPDRCGGTKPSENSCPVRSFSAQFGRGRATAHRVTGVRQGYSA